MRISTSGLYAQGLQGMLRTQFSLSRTQQEMVGGRKLITAADDPAAMATAQRLDHALAALDQYGRSSGLVEHRLRLQEQALSDSSDALIRARELAIQANSASLSDSDRVAIATEIRSLRENLIGIGNREDGSGRRLFAGTRDGVLPFADTGGVVSYSGDDSRNSVDIAPDQAVADTDPGSAIFMRVRTGDGQVRGLAAGGNTGSAVLQSTSIINYATWGGAELTVEFTAPDTYRVMNGTTQVATGPYTPGSAIVAAGMQVVISGDPAIGDTFTVERAPTQDVFATLENIADALDAPATTPAERARRDNVVAATISDLATAQNHMLAYRADTGTRQSLLEATTDSRSAEGISMEDTLSRLRDVDYAEAATQLSLHMTALEAAQSTMVRIQSLSLFDRMR